MAFLLSIDYPTFAEPMSVYVRVRSIQIDYDHGGEINLEVWLSEEIRRQEGRKPFAIVAAQITKQEQLDRDNRPLSILLSDVLQNGEVDRASIYNILRTVTLRSGGVVYDLSQAENV